MNGPGTNTGHGHVWVRPDGLKARCGGPGMCRECQRDAAASSIGAPVQTAGALTADAFKHWLNSVRMHDVSFVFHTLVQHYESALAHQAAPAPEPVAEWTEDLHAFLDHAAGEGYELNGVDAADLCVRIFPDRYPDVLPSEPVETFIRAAPEALAPDAAANERAAKKLTDLGYRYQAGMWGYAGSEPERRKHLGAIITLLADLTKLSTITTKKTEDREFIDRGDVMSAVQAISKAAYALHAAPALAAHPVAGEVPREPTDAMKDAGAESLKETINVGPWGEFGGVSWGDAEACFKAMIAAAPVLAAPPAKAEAVALADDDLVNIAREVGLRSALHGVSVTDARALLRAFVDRLAATPARPSEAREPMTDMSLASNTAALLFAAGATSDSEGGEPA